MVEADSTSKCGSTILACLVWGREGNKVQRKGAKIACVINMTVHLCCWTTVSMALKH